MKDSKLVQSLTVAKEQKQKIKSPLIKSDNIFEGMLTFRSIHDQKRATVKKVYNFFICLSARKKHRYHYCHQILICGKPYINMRKCGGSVVINF